ncbi:hypothetical protein ACEPPN_010822 [Leptodophora sp. 'Broadleaf-Isolate-01']
MATNVLALDPIEIGILHQKGAFELPPQDVQDELISLFFTWVAPTVPVIQEADFLRRYRDPLNPPSLLLLQSIFVSVSRFPRKELHDYEGNPRTDSKTFFKRAKALYDAGYEQDQVTTVQSLVLMGWYWHGPQDVTENGLFYYSRLAIAVAQDCNMDRSAELTNLSQSQHRLYKRIWWTLFTRDRTVTVAYGRPVSIQLDHSSVDPITEDDFVEDGYTPNPIHVQFFLQYVELTKILHMSMLRPIKQRGGSQAEANQCEYELNKWLLDCPEVIRWQQSRHEFWASLLHCSYNTILCLLHGPQRVKTTKIISSTSQTVSSEAVSMILSAAESLISHNQIQYAPPSILYALMTVLATVKEQLTSPLPSIILQSKRKVNTCVRILDALSPTWPITRMISEIVDHVFSEKKFLDKFDAATKQFQDDEESNAGASKRQYKRTVPTAKQSRPEMMLPKARVTVKMLLSTAETGNAVARGQPLTSKTMFAASSEPSQELARGSPTHPNTARDTDTQDDAEDEASGRRSKKPRHSYTSTTPAEDLTSHQNSQGLHLFNENWSSILPPIINDWDAACPAPEQKSPSQSSLDFDQW